ncbi:MAG: alkaline phosphatase, partial [Planctomycetota bacterium]
MLRKTHRSVAAASAAVATFALTAAVFGVPQLTPIGGYGAGVFDESAAEIAAFDAGSAQLFVVNGATDSIDVL